MRSLTIVMRQREGIRLAPRRLCSPKILGAPRRDFTSRWSSSSNTRTRALEQLEALRPLIRHPRIAAMVDRAIAAIREVFGNVATPHRGEPRRRAGALLDAVP
jgi:hypothetical protein